MRSQLKVKEFLYVKNAIKGFDFYCRKKKMKKKPLSQTPFYPDKKSSVACNSLFKFLLETFTNVRLVPSGFAKSNLTAGYEILCG